MEKIFLRIKKDPCNQTFETKLPVYVNMNEKMREEDMKTAALACNKVYSVLYFVANKKAFVMPFSTCGSEALCLSSVQQISN